MSLMTTVIAIALGSLPVNADGTVAAASDSKARQIGRYSQVLDRDGTTRLRGFSRINGRRFDISVKPNGDVHGTVGYEEIRFRVLTAS